VYTIKEASARTGVGAPLIRAWERRYGVVKPVRTPAGYRMYDDETLQVLLAMRSLVESGLTASEAARSIAAGEVSVDEAAARVAAPQGGGPDAETNRNRMIRRFVAAAEAASAMDTEAALDEIMSSGSFEAIVDELLMPALVALGDSWAAGRLSVASEHAASAAVARRLGAAFQAAGAPMRSAVVVGLPPASRHELGVLAFAAAVRRRGIGVLYLGPDVPVDGWIDALRQTRAKVAVVGIPTAADREAALGVIRALRAEEVRVVAVGGAGVDPAPGEGVVLLPPRVVDAAVVVAEAAARRS
jgi:DNA-binding transcriptional MerR regulator/methylmalonyl-CoA mutase cobalamin-binding subunit